MPHAASITPATPARWDSVWNLTEAMARIIRDRFKGVPRDQAGRVTLYAERLAWR
jgi:hypothetical protein